MSVCSKLTFRINNNRNKPLTNKTSHFARMFNSRLDLWPTYDFLLKLIFTHNFQPKTVNTAFIIYIKITRNTKIQNVDVIFVVLSIVLIIIIISDASAPLRRHLRARGSTWHAAKHIFNAHHVVPARCDLWANSAGACCVPVVLRNSPDPRDEPKSSGDQPLLLSGIKGIFHYVHFKKRSGLHICICFFFFKLNTKYKCKKM